MAKKFLTIGSIGLSDFVLSRDNHAQENNQVQSNDNDYLNDHNLEKFYTQTEELCGNENLLILASGNFWKALNKEAAVALAMSSITDLKHKSPKLFEKTNMLGHNTIASSITAELSTYAQRLINKDDITITVILFPNILSFSPTIDNPFLPSILPVRTESSRKPSSISSSHDHFGTERHSLEPLDGLPQQVMDLQLPHSRDVITNNHLGVDNSCKLPVILSVHNSKDSSTSPIPD